jgi:hypothetical protein
MNNFLFKDRKNNSQMIDQIKAIRDGILTAISQSLLELRTSQKLERGNIYEISTVVFAFFEQKIIHF